MPIPIPKESKSNDAIFQQIEEMTKQDVDWRAGRAWSLVYYINEQHMELIQKAHSRLFNENYINPFAFKSLQQMEHEVVQMTADMLNAEEGAVGNMTSGGTESIFLAVYTYWERAKKIKSGIKKPEIVAPVSIHPAFDKACHIMNIKLQKAPVGKDLRVDVQAMQKLINKNTIFLAASAPGYPHAIIDPIEEISVLARRYKLPFHVDGCLGGFMLPWVEKLGFDIPKWDFRLPGVTSISADMHKFGYGAKGSSILVYRNMHYMKYQFFITTEWSGGIYVTPSFLGTRPPGPIAAAWAAINSLGEAGYLKVARANMEAKKKLEAALQSIPAIEILGQPPINILAFTTKNNKPDIFVVADYLEKIGWTVDRLQKPSAIHLIILPQNIPVIDTYIEDLKAAITWAKAHPEKTAEGNAALYGLMAKIPFRGMVKQNVRKIFEDLYGTDKSFNDQLDEVSTPDATILESPKWMGMLNRILGWFRK
jgi:glutamate/tyrosine decarboxylase-like PLP-dependent enzyme